MIRAERLKVVHDLQRVGTLWVDDSDRFHFQYAREWMASPEGFEISLSLPFRDDVYEEGPARFFFTNLLPEGGLRTLVCRRLGISEDNDFGLLSAIGGECAGALALLTQEDEDVMQDGYHVIDEDELAEIMRDSSALPAYTGQRGFRLSLAGAQDKLPVLLREDEILLPLGRAPTSHILKLPSREFGHLAENEAFVTRLADAMGLSVASIELRRQGRYPFTLTRRYDRERLDDGRLRRIHQEDMCQCLGLPPSRKYEQEGGPTFQASFDVVSRTSVDPARDLESLVRWQAFNLLAGNADAHAKNLSMLVEGRHRRRLAPYYDLVCTRIYGRLDSHLATSIGTTSDPGHVNGCDWDELARSVQVSPKWVRGIVEAMTDEIHSAALELSGSFSESYGHNPVFEGICQVIRKQVRRTRQLMQS